MLAFVVGFSVAWFWPDHSAGPRSVRGAVIWSNQEAQEILFEADGRRADSGQYHLAVFEWEGPGANRTMGGVPPCLVAPAGDPVRTDRRPAEIEVVSTEMPDATYRIVVAIRCLS
ncbi:hypothetical protein GCM10010168_71360 [Actinoplanes ianthinogenes]|uniref:Secreted protein n=1 Tax=Actinoplanes ianthinogenes TaxID=122358 RepID=A0ABN6CPY0_9ACTN|nr:hypothetical protein Aiant_79320 [Actinoplanes ianthinogenes]GGR42324.1 hypothetical protein GCM10010168_71360 [Actinoplanes ianthinogenes]